mgnify:CR=1 FL=1
MEKDLSDYRRNYVKKELSLKEVSKNPMELFQKWFYERFIENGYYFTVCERSKKIFCNFDLYKN